MEEAGYAMTDETEELRLTVTISLTVKLSPTKGERWKARFQMARMHIPCFSEQCKGSVGIQRLHGSIERPGSTRSIKFY